MILTQQYCHISHDALCCLDTVVKICNFLPTEYCLLLRVTLHAVASDSYNDASKKRNTHVENELPSPFEKIFDISDIRLSCSRPNAHHSSESNFHRDSHRLIAFITIVAVACWVKIDFIDLRLDEILTLSIIT